VLLSSDDRAAFVLVFIVGKNSVIDKASSFEPAAFLAFLPIAYQYGDHFRVVYNLTLEWDFFSHCFLRSSDSGVCRMSAISMHECDRTYLAFFFLEEQTKVLLGLILSMLSNQLRSG
jgi:hypothetical protein